VQDAILGNSTPGKVGDPGAGSPNRLLYTSPSLNPVITNPGELDPAVGSAYSFQLQATGGAQPYTWAGTNLPPGLALSSAGVLSGTPPTIGRSTASVTVTDAKGRQGLASIVINVVSACSPDQKLVVNPGFEAGATGWAASPGVIGQNGPEQPALHGTWNAWLD